MMVISAFGSSYVAKRTAVNNAGPVSFCGEMPLAHEILPWLTPNSLPRYNPSTAVSSMQAGR